VWGPSTVRGSSGINLKNQCRFPDKCPETRAPASGAKRGEERVQRLQSLWARLRMMGSWEVARG